jgi:hypothetical protein
MTRPAVLLLLRVFFFAAGMCLPRRCLATIREDTNTDKQTDGRDLLITPLRHDTHTKFHKDWLRNSKFALARIYIQTDRTTQQSILMSIILFFQKKDRLLKTLNYVDLVRKQTIPTERPPLVGEVSANFCGSSVSRGQFSGSPRPLISGF